MKTISTDFCPTSIICVFQIFNYSKQPDFRIGIIVIIRVYCCEFDIVWVILCVFSFCRLYFSIPIKSTNRVVLGFHPMFLDDSTPALDSIPFQLTIGTKQQRTFVTVCHFTKYFIQRLEFMESLVNRNFL